MAHGALLRWGLLALLLTAAQLFWLDRKVPWVTPDRYNSACHDLYATKVWRLGFWPGHHGAQLVRTDPRAAPSRDDGPADPELETAMRAELLRSPGKAALELVFYLAVVSVLFAVTEARRLRAWRLGLLPAAGALLLSLPLLLLGYGCTLYSNYVGPGARSYSRPYLTMTFIPAETVSYRAAAEAIGLLPLKLASATHLEAVMADQAFIWQWLLVVVGFYVVAGALLALPFRARRPTSGCS